MYSLCICTLVALKLIQIKSVCGVWLPGLARAPRAPLVVDRALVDDGLPVPWAAAAAAANVAKFCS